jgi:hypothetical protein
MVRLYDPTAGEILLDGVPLREIPLAQLRAASASCRRTPSSSPTPSARTSRSASTRPDPRRGAEDRRIRRRRRRQLDETIATSRRIRHPAGRARRQPLRRPEAARHARAAIARDPPSSSSTTPSPRWTPTPRRRSSPGSARCSRPDQRVVSHRVSAVMDADQILVLEDGRSWSAAPTRSCSAGGVYAALQRRSSWPNRSGGRRGCPCRPRRV